MVEICVWTVSRVLAALLGPALAETRLSPQGHFQDCASTRSAPTNQSRSFSRTRNPRVVSLTPRQTLLVSLNPRQTLVRNSFDSRIRMDAGTSQNRSLCGGSRNAIWWLQGNDVALGSGDCVVGSGGLCHEVCSMLL